MGRGGQDKKIIWRGLCQILKNMGRGGGGLPGKKITSGVGYILYIYTEKSQVGCQDTAIKCCTPLLEKKKIIWGGGGGGGGGGLKLWAFHITFCRQNNRI